ncbi:MAG: hypothetical protein QXU81_08295 [Candidatus Bathyarchaeia archaeon]
MGVGLPKPAATPDEFWRQFKEHMQYTDEELENFRKDPRKVRMAQKIASPDVLNKTLVFEVVDYYACAEGMRPGDRLFFKGGILLDPTRSSNWCGFSLAYSAAMYAAIFQNLVFHDIDPGQFVHTVRDCGDATPRFGWGQTVYKIYVVDETKEKISPQRRWVGHPRIMPGESEEDFFRRFKEHMRFTDDDIKRFREDPVKVKTIFKMASPEVRDKNLVLEVAYSKGCIAGMRPGDKLYMIGGVVIDMSRSSPWCAYALSFATAQLGAIFQNLILHGIHPNEMYVKYLSCGDCGPEFGGWGKVIYRIYAIEEK